MNGFGQVNYLKCIIMEKKLSARPRSRKYYRKHCIARKKI